MRSGAAASVLVPTFRSSTSSSSSSLTSIFGPEAWSESGEPESIFLPTCRFLLLDVFEPEPLLALGQSPSLSSHWSHLGPTGAHMV